MKFSGLDCPDKGLVLIAGRPGIGKTTQIIKFIETNLQKEHHKIAMLLRGQNHFDAENQTCLPCDKTYYQYLHNKPDIYKVYVNDLNQTDSFIFNLKQIIFDKHPRYIFIDTVREQGSVCKSGSMEKQMIRALIDVCKQEDVLIFAECIPKRSLERRKDKRPNKSDLIFSAAVLSEVNKIIYLYRNDYYDLDLPSEECVAYDEKSGSC